MRWCVSICLFVCSSITKNYWTDWYGNKEIYLTYLLKTGLFSVFHTILIWPATIRMRSIHISLNDFLS